MASIRLHFQALRMQILRMMRACSEPRTVSGQLVAALSLRRNRGFAAPCGEYGVDHCSALELHGLWG